MDFGTPAGRAASKAEAPTAGAVPHIQFR